MCEMHHMNKRKAKAEFWDLVPVAKATGNKLIWAEKPIVADKHIITAGRPRQDASQSKESLFGWNLGIVSEIVKHMHKTKKPIYIATNPPKEITLALKRQGYDTRELRTCTDQLRSKAGDLETLNSQVINGKGTTQFTPALAIAMEVMRE